MEGSTAYSYPTHSVNDSSEETPMARPQNKFDLAHLRNLDVLRRQIDEIFKAATNEAARIGVSIDVDTDKPFSFSDYPSTQKRVKELLSQLQASIEVCIVNGIDSEWTLANNKNNELCNAVFGKNKGKLSQSEYRRYYSTNESARDAFIARKQGGLGLSDRVWRFTDEFKEEIEMGLDLGIRGGLSADQMSRDLRQYLRHPDMLFRRVRDEHGILHLSKRAKAFHPGRGVYRSSYLNARRLATTEGNIAYRTADHERWQQLDFVVGIEIHLSGNHTCKGRDGKPHEFTDICDELAGRYPKDFKFTGWHPNCRCYATSILKTEEEMAADTQKLLRGEPVNGESVNAVRDVPENFKQWVRDNQERIESASSLPYFLKDNMGYFTDAQALSITERAALRHSQRTTEEREAILKAWENRKKHNALVNKVANNILKVAKDYGEIDYSGLEAAITSGNINTIDSVTKSVAQQLVAMKKAEQALSDLIPDVHQWHKQFTLSELQTAYNAVENTINTWLKKYNYSSWDTAALLHKKAKLEQEILHINKKYSTWEVAEKAYQAKLAIVNNEIILDSLNNKLLDFKTFILASKTKSTKFKSDVKQLERLILNKQLNDAQLLVNKLEAHKAKLSSKKAFLIIAPKSTNNSPQIDHIGSGYTDIEKINIIKACTGVDDKTALEYKEAIEGFSYQWDYEIRQVQCGNKVVSRYGHTEAEILKRAQNCENFIAASPQWVGGTTYRGLSLSDKEVEQLRNDLKAGKGNMLGSASWSTSESVSQGFAGFHIGETSLTYGDIKNTRVVLVCKKQHRKGTSIKHLSRYAPENEVLVTMASRYKYVREFTQGQYLYFEVSSK